MLVRVTLRLMPHLEGPRLSPEELRQEAERVMGELSRHRSAGAVEDVMVASDANSGRLTVEGIVASAEESSALGEFVAYFQRVMATGERGVAGQPVEHLILEGTARILDQTELTETLDRAKMMELLAPLTARRPEAERETETESGDQARKLAFPPRTPCRSEARPPRRSEA